MQSSHCLPASLHLLVRSLHDSSGCHQGTPGHHLPPIWARCARLQGSQDCKQWRNFTRHQTQVTARANRPQSAIFLGMHRIRSSSQLSPEGWLLTKRTPRLPVTRRRDPRGGPVSVASLYQAQEHR